MKIVVLDPTGVVFRKEREIRDWSSLDYEYVCEDMADFIDNDCIVQIYHSEVLRGDRYENIE